MLLVVRKRVLWGGIKFKNFKYKTKKIKEETIVNDLVLLRWQRSVKVYVKLFSY